MDWSQCPAVDRHPDKMGGVWCFAGTRLPVASMFEHLDDEVTIDEFIETFPVVTREQVHEILGFVLKSLEQPVMVA